MTNRPPLAGTVLITGASSGIGRALALRVCPEAREVILVARRTDRLEALAQELVAARVGLQVHIETCDLADLGQVEAMCDRVLARGDVDVLINNAGFGDRAFLEESDWTKLHRMVAVNVTALAYLTRRFVEGMVQRGDGGIMNVGSVLGRTTQPSAAMYAGTKHFVWGFCEALRAEVASAGVTVTEVCPGPVSTEFRMVAGTRAGVSSPSFMQIDAGRCADEALLAFRRGHAVVFPGRKSRWLMRVLRWVPRPLLRWFMARSGARARAA